MSAPIELISFRAFARRDGCDESRVRRGVKNGELPRLSGKRLPADLAGTGWRARNRLVADTADTPHEPVGESAPTLTLAEAEWAEIEAEARMRA